MLYFIDITNYLRWGLRRCIAAIRYYIILFPLLSVRFEDENMDNQFGGLIIFNIKGDIATIGKGDYAWLGQSMLNVNLSKRLTFQLKRSILDLFFLPLLQLSQIIDVIPFLALNSIKRLNQRDHICFFSMCYP